MGERISRYRKEAGLSQEQLAQQLNVSRQAVSKWERDEAVPDVANIVALAKIFHISTDQLITGEEKEKVYQPYYASRSRNEIHLFTHLIKTKGYIGGYIIAGYGVLALILTRFAHFSFRQSLLPEGFEVTFAELPTQMKLPLYFTNGMSVVAALVILFGLVVAIRLKKKSRMEQGKEK